MKTAVITGLNKIEILETDPPDIINSDDVLLKIRGVGICGSDVHYYRHGRIGDQKVSFPFRPGHECSGEVVKTGTAVSKLKIGDRVAVDPLIFCGTCEQCRIGREHTCLNQKFLGAPGQAPGALAEYIVIPEKCCFKIPVEMSWPAAVFVEPLAIGIYSVDFMKPHKDSTLVILGSGPIGLSVLLAARSAGYERIYITEKLQYRLDTALRIGAQKGINILENDFKRLAIEEYKSGFDYIIECCGEQEACNQGIELLKPGGKLIITGIPSAEQLIFDPHQMRRKEITVHNVRRQNNCIGRAIELASKPEFPLSDLVTHNFNLEQISQAFELVSGYHDNVVKAIVTF